LKQIKLASYTKKFKAGFNSPPDALTSLANPAT